MIYYLVYYGTKYNDINTKTCCPIYLIQTLFSRFKVDFSAKAMKWVSEFKLAHNNVSGRKVGSDPN